MTAGRAGRAGRRRRAGARAGRHADAPAVPVLPSRADAGLADRADAARGRRPDHRARSPRAFLVPEATMAQRISRAKQRDQGQRASPFGMPPASERAERLARRAARALPDLQRGLHGDAPGPTCTGPSWPARRSGWPGRLHRAAARRRRGRRAAGADAAHRRPPAGPHRPDGDAGAAGRAGPRPLGPAGDRRGRRAGHRGAGRRGAVGPVPAAGGDRRGARRGAAAPRRPTGRRSSACTTCCSAVAPDPMVTLNRAVAVAMVHGPARASAARPTLDGDERLAGHHRLAAVRAHLLEHGRRPDGGASSDYGGRRGARPSLPEQRYLRGAGGAAGAAAGLRAGFNMPRHRLAASRVARSYPAACTYWPAYALRRRVKPGCASHSPGGTGSF